MSKHFPKWGFHRQRESSQLLTEILRLAFGVRGHAQRDTAYLLASLKPIQSGVALLLPPHPKPLIETIQLESHRISTSAFDPIDYFNDIAISN